MNPGGRPPRKDVDTAEIRRLRAAGHSWREIAEQLGIPSSTAYRHGRKEGNVEPTRTYKYRYAVASPNLSADMSVEALCARCGRETRKEEHEPKEAIALCLSCFRDHFKDAPDNQTLTAFHGVKGPETDGLEPKDAAAKLLRERGEFYISILSDVPPPAEVHKIRMDRLLEIKQNDPERWSRMIARAASLRDFILAMRSHRDLDHAVDCLRKLAHMERSAALRLLLWVESYEGLDKKRPRLYPIPVELVRSWPNKNDLILCGLSVAQNEVDPEDGQGGLLRFQCADCGADSPSFIVPPGWKPLPVEDPPGKLKDRLLLRLCCDKCIGAMLDGIRDRMKANEDHDSHCRCPSCSKIRNEIVGHTTVWYYATLGGTYTFFVIRDVTVWLMLLRDEGHLAGHPNIDMLDADSKHIIAYCTSGPEDESPCCVQCGKRSGLDADEGFTMPKDWSTVLWGGTVPDKLAKVPIDFLVCPACAGELEAT